MTDDATLGGYFRVHTRPPAFEGADGKAYSVAIYTAAEADADGRHGAALLFVRWSDEGERPAGHLETEYLVFGATRGEAEARVGELTLHAVKQHLDRLIAAQKPAAGW